MRRGVFCCISSQQAARQSDSYARKGVFRPLFRVRHHPRPGETWRLRG